MPLVRYSICPFLLLRGIVSRRMFSPVTGVCQTPLFLRSVLRGIPRKRFFVLCRLPVGVFFVLSRLSLPISAYSCLKWPILAYFSYKIIWAFPLNEVSLLHLGPPRKLSICGGEEKTQQIQRACSFGLTCAFRRGRALQGFASSALIHNTIALPIPNARKKNYIKR